MKRVSWMGQRALLLVFALASFAGQANDLQKLGHIHGIAFGGEEGETLLLATHQGLFSYEQERAQRISDEVFDVMGFAIDANRKAIFASGHPASGGNTGLLKSIDGGISFERLSLGVAGPVDFHQLTVSGINPEIVYGVHGKLQISADGGASWRVQSGSLPPKLLQLAASDVSDQRLYAASEQGLYLSDDQGKSWRQLFPYPATSVVVAHRRVYAFVVGKGVVASAEETLFWREIDNRFGAQVLLDLAIAEEGLRMVGLTQMGTLVESVDQGLNWRSLPPGPQPSSAQEKRGQLLFQKNCQSCHGIAAVGETYSIESLTTQNYLFAPALNGSAHAWHHLDEQLVDTILEGSPRTPKMPAWKESMSEQDARDVVAYFKSLWQEKHRRCQGPKHMDRDCLAE
ncbi:c-type cytochrome [Aestuariirhabdus sp. LZHN29]|uniref:c-type cytochrome n=1 Tax=Aestuariirhabdus sp. LZHN29 TaxID=3417462 RepID=UPI003CEAB558